MTRRRAPSHKNVCNFFFNNLLADKTPNMLRLCSVTKLKVPFLVLAYVFFYFFIFFYLTYLCFRPPFLAAILDNYLES